MPSHCPSASNRSGVFSLQHSFQHGRHDPTSGPLPLSSLDHPPSSTPATLILHPPTEPHRVCFPVFPACFRTSPLCSAGHIPAPAVPTTPPLPTAAVQPFHLDFRATGFRKLPWQRASRLPQPRRRCSSLSLTTLHSNRLFACFSITLLLAKDNIFFNLGPQPLT